MVNSREQFAELLEAFHEAWAEEGKPADMATPALKTFVEDSRPFKGKGERFLAGKVPNMQSAFERGEFQTSGIAKAKERPDHDPTILEIACGLGANSQLEKLMARVAVYASQHARDEANAVAFSTFITVDDQYRQNFLRKIFFRSRKARYRLMKDYLQHLVGQDGEHYLSMLFPTTIKNFNIEHDGFTAVVIACVEFWQEYGEWREVSLSGSGSG
ncbi:hypothetical protein [Notoacmeibacter marinus]|uniref:hypothetical protein n=1 Tax=Notoacmeibacter marinus TaxID=1876515 RepID=UPI00117A64EC|nr:hypothetical protein [Notoacmeibacter marinus]